MAIHQTFAFPSHFLRLFRICRSASSLPFLPARLFSRRIYRQPKHHSAACCLLDQFLLLGLLLACPPLREHLRRLLGLCRPTTLTVVTWKQTTVSVLIVVIVVGRIPIHFHPADFLLPFPICVLNPLHLLPRVLHINTPPLPRLPHKPRPAILPPSIHFLRIRPVPKNRRLELRDRDDDPWVPLGRLMLGLDGGDEVAMSGRRTP